MASKKLFVFRRFDHIFRACHIKTELFFLFYSRCKELVQIISQHEREREREEEIETGEGESDVMEVWAGR